MPIGALEKSRRTPRVFSPIDGMPSSFTYHARARRTSQRGVNSLVLRRSTREQPREFRSCAYEDERSANLKKAIGIVRARDDRRAR